MIKILLVDDEADLTRLMKANLERTGRFAVRTENQGARALEAAREFRPDLIVLDVMMPDMSGDDVAAALAEDPVLCSTPHIFLTAIVTRAETTPTGSEIGGHTFVAKPVSLADLVAAIDRVLGTSP